VKTGERGWVAGLMLAHVRRDFATVSKGWNRNKAGPCLARSHSRGCIATIVAVAAATQWAAPTRRGRRRTAPDRWQQAQAERKWPTRSAAPCGKVLPARNNGNWIDPLLEIPAVRCGQTMSSVASRPCFGRKNYTVRGRYGAVFGAAKALFAVPTLTCERSTVAHG